MFLIRVVFPVVFFILFGCHGDNGKAQDDNKTQTVSCQCGQEKATTVPIEAGSVKEAEKNCNSKGKGYELQECTVVPGKPVK